MRSLRWQQVGTKGDWENTIAMVADRGFLWSVEADGTLFKTDKDGNYEQVGPKGILSEVTLIVAMDNALYVVENGTLYRTRG
jgi:hypothetical protein